MPRQFPPEFREGRTLICYTLGPRGRLRKLPMPSNRLCLWACAICESSDWQGFPAGSCRIRTR